MILALLVAAAGSVPIILGFFVLILFGRSRVTLALFAHMCLMGIWQFDIASLFISPQYLNETVILWMFKIFRAGPIFCIPILLLLSYHILKEERFVKRDAKRLTTRIYNACVNRHTIKGVFIWSSVIYAINLSPWGVSKLYIVNDPLLNNAFFYPKSGPLGNLVILHFGLYILTLILVLGLSLGLSNRMLKRFMLVFTIASLITYISALLNLNPNHNMLYSNITVTIYSCIIIFEFIRLYTQIIREYQKVAEKQSKLEHAGNLASSLIHEINNITAIIKGTGQLLPRITPLTENAKIMVENMNEATTQLENLTTSYKTFIKNNSIDISPSNENISKIAEKAYMLNKHRFEDATVFIHITKNEIFGYVDKVYMTQVFTNLMLNSIDAMPENHTNKSIEINIDLIGHTIMIDIKDTGCGIPPEKLDVLFKPFVSTKDKGMGLGLALCENVMFAHRGTIKIVKSDENGTHFQLALPKDRFETICGDERCEQIW